MPDPTEDFFNQLSRSRYQPQLARFTGSVRVDVSDDEQTDHWLLTVTQGTVAVSREERPADLVISAGREAFHRAVTAAAEIPAMFLRDELRLEGNLELVNVLRRLAAASPGHHPQEVVHTGGDRGR